MVIAVTCTLKAQLRCHHHRAVMVSMAHVRPPPGEFEGLRKRAVHLTAITTKLSGSTLMISSIDSAAKPQGSVLPSAAGMSIVRTNTSVAVAQLSSYHTNVHTLTRVEWTAHFKLQTLVLFLLSHLGAP